tara:strand:- start:2659 stop:3630 length:972 start_codon:yes stop_codon:yes gene_type:complete
MLSLKKLLRSTLLVSVSLLVGLLICESILRIKHKLIINYDIEMWKYAKELKTKVKNKKINHIHIKNKSAILQNTEIKINKYGQRDIDYDNSSLSKFDRSFLIIGSSVAMGWGVDYDKVFSNRLNKISLKNNKNWIFINGGVGNYNTERYVNNYFENWSELKFTDIIVHFFVNDTEIIKPAKVNFFTNNFHLGVVVWKLLNSYVSAFNPEKVEKYYLDRYQDNYEGFNIAKKELLKLSNHCKKNSINCHIILMPDIHKLNPYKLKFINKKMKKIAAKFEFQFHDLLNIFEGKDEKTVWNKYGDPHPNAYANSLMGDNIFLYLNR